MIGSMMNGLQILTFFKKDFNNPAGAILGLMNAVYPLGKVVALFVVTPVADRFGRKIPMAFGLVGCVGFAILQGLSPNFTSFVIARAFLGFMTSFVAQPSPVLITEMAYPTQRGKLTSLYNTFFVSLTNRPIPPAVKALSLLSWHNTIVPWTIRLTSLIVLWRHLRRLVDIRDIQNSLHMELEDPFHYSGGDSTHSTLRAILCSRIAKVSSWPTSNLGPLHQRYKK